VCTARSRLAARLRFRHTSGARQARQRRGRAVQGKPDRRLGWAIEQLAHELAVQLQSVCELHVPRGVTARSIGTALGLDSELTDAQRTEYLDQVFRAVLEGRQRTGGDE
jgi:hypothetical protein